MTWRTVVISRRSKLFFKMGHMVIRDFENKITKIYLKDISHVILTTTEISITAALMNEFQKQKIKLIISDEKGNPSAELTPLYNSFNSTEKIKAQIKWKKTTKQYLWQLIVKEKIKKQMYHLKDKGLDEYKLLETYINQVRLNDKTNREAHAAKVYFNALFGKNFSRNDNSSLNACLNYGYAIILSTINRTLVSMGYLTQLGIFHDNMFNQFNLSSDIIEVWRILIDMEVCNMDYNVFDSCKKINLISILNQKIKFDGKTYFVNQAIYLYCKSIIDALNENDISLVRFPEYEL